MSRFTSLDTLFELPRRIKILDMKISTFAVCGFEEENMIKLYNKILKMKELRNSLYNKYVKMVETFNSFNQRARNAIGAVYKNNMSVRQVAKRLQITERSVNRMFDNADKMLEEILKENIYETVK